MSTLTMHTENLAPLFSTDKLPETRDFYLAHLGFEVFFENEQYCCLRCPSNPKVEVAFMTPPSPDEPRGTGAGLMYVLGVEDVDAEHGRLTSEGVSIHEAPEDMPWGDRRLTLLDPNGILLYLCHAITPAGEYAGRKRD